MRDIKDYTENYVNLVFEDYQVMYRRKLVLEIIRKYPHRRILEIGCGMEPLFKYLDSKEYDQYVVIEPSEQFCKNAIKESLENEKITCINDYFDASEKVKQYKFDFIICSSLLHEVENPEELLKNIAMICTKSTIVHINVPNANSFHRLLAKEMNLIDDVHEMSDQNKLYQQHNVYDKTRLGKTVETAGFSVIEAGSYFVKPFTHKQMFDMLENHIINEKVLDGLYNIVKYFPEYGSEIFVNVSVGRIQNR